MYNSGVVTCDFCSDNLIDKDYQITRESNSIKHFCNNDCKIKNMEKLKLDIFNVGDKFRTNELSKITGGSTVIVQYKNGRKLSYTNIKNAAAYIKRLKLNNVNVANAWVKTELDEN